MGLTEDMLLDMGVEKLLNLGFTNVNRTNILTDPVYMYHFRAVLKLLHQTGNEDSKTLDGLLRLIENGLNGESK